MVHVLYHCTKGMVTNVNAANSSGIKLLSIVGKLIKRVRAGNECAIGE